MNPKDAGVVKLQRAMVVDDNIDSARTLGLLLELQGLEVTTVHDGVEALKLYTKLSPDLVLLDIDLPGMDGLQLAEQFRYGRNIPPALLIAVSGYGRPEDVARCRDAGFDHHFRKPIEVDRLMKIIDAFQLRPTSQREG